MNPTVHIFPFAEFWPLYSFFLLVVGFLLWLSLRLNAARVHEVSIREATITALSWFGIALLFNAMLYFFTWWRLEQHPEIVAALGGTADSLARSTALEFLSGYLVEKSLAVDNLFVFLVIFRFFSVAPQYQQRVLFYGLFGALLFRAIFIAMGAVVMDIPLVVIFFGLFLMYQGVQVLKGDEPEMDPEKNRILRFLNRYLPVSSTMAAEKFFTREAGKWMVTPLFVTLVFVEITDIMFAFDSVPAIFGLTKEPMVVFTSNIFAVIDLRALYFLLAAFISRFHYLNYGLSFVLVFIGAKMAILDELLDIRLPTEISLLVVMGLIVGAIVLSLVKPPKDRQDG
jgi:tellurite resistance protein TerC